ncbi:MAG: hypothetical protein K2Y22_06150 [Candidatus Obscuribacterales bacterium]|nr:hypothetical protein [Candidatus Obscuribacterales bacterium]
MSAIVGMALWLSPSLCLADNTAPIHKKLDGSEGQPNTNTSLIIPVDRTNFLKEFLDPSKPYIVLAFLQPACAPDGGSTPHADQLLEKMAAEFGSKGMKFIRINIQKSPKITAKFRAQLHIDDQTFICISYKTKTDRLGSGFRKELNEANLRVFLQDALNNDLQWVPIGKQVPLPFRILMELQEKALK